MKKLTFLTMGGLVTAVLLTLFFAASPAASAQERFLPEDTPDAETGLAIFNERCTVCHGDTAQGDGPQAIEAGLEPTIFADPEFRLTAQPQRMYDFITNGNLANGMPPFGPASSNPIAEMDRWHLIAAIYSFSTPPESIALGEEIVTEQGGADWPDTDYWFTRTNEDALADLEAGDFGLDTADLSDEEKMAVVDYGRAQSYNFLDPFAPPEPIKEAIISGQVINGSTDEPVSEGTVTLRAFTFDLEEMLNETTELDEDGRYSFTLTDVDPEWVYLASVENEDLTFNSSAAQI
ncbi:MAG TPA: cytochrome c, partial [Anaerolineae bacterium]|nr:cytochrome c [Anaerolineae bacterium]